ncbi:hypothetical protein [Paenibacillus silviterrae]|uniref:hypothetical protein n=1 Tax=Paenibacillus silviterrae TaxID=3242194 RepID=UPI0025439478|nr:hypothetical protein [Paenibacillus chinjuensis]
MSFNGGAALTKELLTGQALRCTRWLSVYLKTGHDVVYGIEIARFKYNQISFRRP